MTIPVPYYALSFKYNKEVIISAGEKDLYDIWIREWAWKSKADNPEAQVLSFVGKRKVKENIDWEYAKNYVQMLTPQNISFPTTPESLHEKF
jgi:hypothetical protein